jgi:hypothetical protein
VLSIFAKNVDKESLEKKIEDFNNHFRKCYEAIQTKGQPIVQQINPIVVGKNKTHEYIYKQLIFDCNSCDKLPACIFLENSNENKFVIDCIDKYINHEPTEYHFLNVLKKIPCQISTIYNTICVGCSIFFRKNQKSPTCQQSICNGQRAILVNINYPQNFKIIEIKKIFFENYWRNICIYEGELPLLIFNSGNRNITLAATNETIKYNQNNILNKRYFQVYYIQLAYSSTLHQTQGSTINDSFCATECVLLSQTLRSFYVLVSRACEPEQIILPENVLNKTKNKIFNSN